MMKNRWLGNEMPGGSQGEAEDMEELISAYQRQKRRVEELASQAIREKAGLTSPQLLKESEKLDQLVLRLWERMPREPQP